MAVEKTEYQPSSESIVSHKGPVEGKKIVMDAPGGIEVLKLVDFEFPEPSGHEVRVRVEAIGLNYIEIYLRSGVYPPEYPSGLGSDGAGYVESVGPDVTTVKVGDRVTYAFGPNGSYGDYYIVPESDLIKLPDDISFETAASLTVKGLTAQFLVKQVQALQEGDIVVFWAAAGGVGLIALQWLKALGVKTIAITSGGAKAEAALNAGAWKVLDHKTEDVVARVLELTDNRKAKVVFDSVGKATWERSLDMTAKHGLIVCYGYASGVVDPVDLRTLAFKGSVFVTFASVYSYADTPRRLNDMASEMFEMVKSGHIKVSANRRYSLSNVAQAHLDLEAGKTIGSSVAYPDAIAKKVYNL